METRPSGPRELVALAAGLVLALGLTGCADGRTSAGGSLAAPDDADAAPADAAPQVDEAPAPRPDARQGSGDGDPLDPGPSDGNVTPSSDTWQPSDPVAADVADAASDVAVDDPGETVPDADADADAAAGDDVDAPDTGDPPEAGAPDDGASATPDAGPDPGPDAESTPSVAPTGCVDDVSAGHHRPSCAGLVFDLHVPARCLDARCGLILDVHGLTMSAAQQDANTDLRGLGELHGYVVVQPNANPAPPAAFWTPFDDDARVLEFLDDAVAAFDVDPDRVHMTGFSQGGFMTWRMLCHHADRFASVAPAAGCTMPLVAGCAFTGGELPARKIPVLYMHGTRDVLVAFGCAETQRDALVAAWGLTLDGTVSSDAKHTWLRYTGPDGAHFEFLAHHYAAATGLLGGHCYPGSDDPGGAAGQLFSYRCVEESPFHWGDAAIRFFMAHPRRP